MCRNIKTLFNFEPPATEEEIRAASLQYVRKVTGFNKPSKANEAAFYSAVEDIARISERLLASLETAAPPKDREEEAAKAKARSAPSRAASPGCCRSSRATDGKTLMTMVQRGFPSAELRDEHRAGLTNAFARLEQAIE